MQPVASALCTREHSAFASVVLHNAIRLEQGYKQFVAAVTRRQTRAQSQVSPDISAADENYPGYSWSKHNMVDCIKAGYAHDDQCGSPDSEKLWPHMYANDGLWIHRSGSESNVVPDYDNLR